jgi:hypothetical protein
MASLSSALDHLLKAKRISALSQSYAKDNPAEYAKVKVYLDGGARPSGVVTEMGLGLVEVEDVRRSVTPPPSGGSLPTAITTGGTYSGTATSTVQVRTSQPVLIENSTLSASGLAPLIDANYPGVDLTVRYSVFNADKGQHVKAFGFKRIVLDHNDFNKGWGVRADNGQAGCTFVVTSNRFRNQTYANHPDWLAHSIQLVNTLTPILADISWNECIGEFGQSQTEDVISLYNAAYAKVHDNFVRGAYPASLGASYTGGGIIVDGPQCHHNELYDNIVVDTSSTGIARSVTVATTRASPSRRSPRAVSGSTLPTTRIRERVSPTIRLPQTRSE